jgi:predicted ABC-type ATPase
MTMSEEVGLDVRDANGMEHDKLGLFASKGNSGGKAGGEGGRESGSRRDDADRSGWWGSKYKHHASGLSFPKSVPSDKNVGLPKATAQKPPVFRLPRVEGRIPEKNVANYTDRTGTVHDTRVDRITNRPVSQEFEDAISRLYRGEDISPDELERTVPELRNEKELADVLTRYDKLFHPENYENMDEKLNKAYVDFSSPVVTSDTNDSLKPGESYQVKQGREAWIVTGLPGSGKSTGFVGPISKFNGCRVVDSDAIKEHIPGFCGGLGAPKVHEMSKSINDMIMSDSIKRGDNIVYPVLGYNADYVGDQIDSMRRKGYKVHLILNELPFPIALGRCLDRRLAKGRNIPLDMFRKVGDRPSQAYEELKKKVDTYQKHSGDAVTRTLVENGVNENLPPPPREKVYTYNGMPLGEYSQYSVGKNGDVSFGETGSQNQFKKPERPWHETFHVKQNKPKYWGWGFQHAGHDAQDGAEGAQDAPQERVDKLGNVSLLDARSNRAPSYDVSEIPDSYEDEIESYETAFDSARFAYVMSGE